MQIIRPPVGIAEARRHVGRGEAQAGEADIVVDPVLAVGINIEPARPVVEIGVEDDIDGNAVGRLRASERAGRNFAESRQQADRLDIAGALQHLPIARHENAHIRKRAQRAWQRGRNFAETASLNVVGDFGGDEKNPASRAKLLSLRGLALKVAMTLCLPTHGFAPAARNSSRITSPVGSTV